MKGGEEESQPGARTWGCRQAPHSQGVGARCAEPRAHLQRPAPLSSTHLRVLPLGGSDLPKVTSQAPGKRSNDTRARSGACGGNHCLGAQQDSCHPLRRLRGDPCRRVTLQQRCPSGGPGMAASQPAAGHASEQWQPPGPTGPEAPRMWPELPIFLSGDRPAGGRVAPA